MTINTQKLREAAANAKDLTAEDLIGFRLTATAHITGLARAIESCCDHIDAQAEKMAETESQTDRYRRASERWKKVAESAEERARDQAAEIAEAKGQFEHLDRQNNALRDVLRSLADIDLAGPMPNDFAWFVLRARAALSGESND